MTTPESKEDRAEKERLTAISDGMDAGAGWTAQNQDVHPATGNPALEQAVADQMYVEPTKETKD